MLITFCTVAEVTACRSDCLSLHNRVARMAEEKQHVMAVLGEWQVYGCGSFDTTHADRWSHHHCTL